MTELRRPTKDIERVLQVAKEVQAQLIKSRRYTEMSVHKNRGKWLESARDLEVSNRAFIAALEWVLGIGLSEEGRMYTLTEVERECDNT
jgi:cystathionine beta-lyase family protein involved in aluminum resistance